MMELAFCSMNPESSCCPGGGCSCHPGLDSTPTDSSHDGEVGDAQPQLTAQCGQAQRVVVRGRHWRVAYSKGTPASSSWKEIKAR